MSFLVFLEDDKQLRKPTVALGRMRPLSHPDGVMCSVLSSIKAKKIGGVTVYTPKQAQKILNDCNSSHIKADSLKEGENGILSYYTNNTYVYCLTDAELQSLAQLDALRVNLKAVDATIEAAVPAALREEQKQLQADIAGLAKKFKL